MMNDEFGQHNEKSGDLKAQTKAYALQLLRLCAAVPKSAEVWEIRKQLIGSGTSPGAHYREACRSRSRKEFVSKIEGGLQELDESLYWMELLVEGEFVPENRLQDLMTEGDELISMMAASAKRAKGGENAR